jgi:putative addiction module component (TIGR02574 family)
MPIVRSPDTLEREVLRLPKADRARLAEVLLTSLAAEDAAASPAEIEAAWETEIARRVAELRDGTVVGIPAEQVFAEVLDR